MWMSLIHWDVWTCKWLFIRQTCGSSLRISSDTCGAKISGLYVVLFYVLGYDVLNTEPLFQVLWLLSFDDKNTLADAVDKYCIGVPPIQWLAWIPQLLTCLVGSEGKPLLNLISQVCTSIILLFITMLMWPRVHLYCLLAHTGKSLAWSLVMFSNTERDVCCLICRC